MSTAAAHLLRLPEVIALTGMQRSTIYDSIRAGTFPAPVHLTATARAWVEGEVHAFIAARIAARDAGAGR